MYIPIAASKTVTFCSEELENITIATKIRPTNVIEMETIHPSRPYCYLFPPEKMIVSPVFGSLPVMGTS